LLLLNDTKTRFGLVSVFLHWYIAAAILILLPVGLLILYLGPHGPLRSLRADLTWWHMSIGVTSIPFFLFRIFWRTRNGKPKTHYQHWALRFTADSVWRLLLVLIVWQIFSGPLLELSHDNPVHWFYINLIRPPLPSWLMPIEGYFHNAHVYGAFAIGALLVLHIGGALKHYIVDRDQVLQGMLRPARDDRAPAADLPLPGAAVGRPALSRE
jgi:cytochrome b561